jgi:hypothetical protein
LQYGHQRIPSGTALKGPGTSGSFSLLDLADVYVRPPARAGEPPQERHQPEVAERVGELCPMGGLDVRQQVEFAAVVEPVVRSAERDAAVSSSQPPSERGTRCAGSTGRLRQTRHALPATFARCTSEAELTAVRRSGVRRRIARRRSSLACRRSGFRLSRPLRRMAVARGRNRHGPRPLRY